MTVRIAAFATALAAALAAIAAAPAGVTTGASTGLGIEAGLLAIEWPDWLRWGERWELDDLRHAVDVHPPVALERWLHNPRERTAEGLRRLEEQGPAEALAAFESAGRLAPADREVQLNLGTARLLGDHGDAVGALERAVAAPEDGNAETAPLGRPLDPETLRRAWYNLGAARLAAGRTAGAVTAFEEALRLDPSDGDAKFNLELALRRLEEERLRLRPPRETAGGDRPGDEEPSEEPGGAEPEATPEEDPEGGRDPAGEGAEAETVPRDGAPMGRRPLASFEEQRDLSAVQAAALLDAVENLERRQRRLEAARAVEAGGSATEEDW